jgi:hypothetical protein
MTASKKITALSIKKILREEYCNFMRRLNSLA